MHYDVGLHIFKTKLCLTEFIIVFNLYSLNLYLTQIEFRKFLIR